MKLIYKNNRGVELDLLNNQDHFVIVGADNLHGVELDFAESASPYIDGTSVDNVRAASRGIVLTFQFVGDVQAGVDLFTSVIKSKQVGYLTETDENGREIRIKGVVKVPPYTRLSDACQIQLELYCGQPYWQDVEAVVNQISATIDLLYLPEDGRGFPPEGVPFGEINVERSRTIVNDGDTSVGMKISIVALDSTSNPRISCSTGTQNGWYMELALDMAAGDEVIISTERGNKYITLNGSQYVGSTPILSLLTVKGDDWLQLEQGENTFNITASDDTLLYFNLEYRRRYE